LNKTSNEFKLLILVSQITPSRDKILALFKKGIRQEYLVDLALANGVLPLVYQELSKHKEFSIHHNIKKYALKIKNTNFFMSAQLLQLVFLLKEKNISILPIKGPLLAEHAYKDLGLRPFSDLDILAKEDDLTQIAEILLKMGYQNEKDLCALTHPFILKNFSDISFIHPTTELVIELHWKLLKSSRAALSDISALFKHQIILPFQNTELPSLDLEEEFLYLCVHAAKHRFERIEWMNDLNHLYELHSKDYDWNKLLLLAEDENYLSPYHLALSILESHFHRDLHNPKPNYHIKIQKLHKKVFLLHSQDYVLKEKKTGIRWMELSFSIQLEDSFLKKISLLKTVLFPLYIDDILKMKKLPKYLTFLYYFNRIRRVLGFN